MSRYREEYGPSDDLGPDEVEYSEDDYYETESASVRRARGRRRKAMITVGVLLLSLFFAFWWAYSYYKDGDSKAKSSAGATATCQPADPTKVTPAQVTLNVYNATKKAGFAASTAQGLKKLGFQVATVSNDPLTSHKVTTPAEVRFGPNGKAQADLVIKTVGSGAVAVQDGRADASVDLVLGEGFTAPSKAATPSESAGAQSLPVCPSPSASTSPAASGAASPAASPSQ